MSTSAKVLDISLGQFRRSMQGTEAESAGVFSDMADGAAVMQLFFNFAGFELAETKIFMPVAELCGDAGRSVELYDEELAEFARCTDRTVRNWRRDYLARAATVSFHPLEITEGEYDREKQRYERTGYTVAAGVVEQIERAVVAARSMPDYESDRMGCLERAARFAYDNIPDAPAKKDRKRKPKKSQADAVKIFANARKGVEKGRRALAELEERRRKALMAGRGEELRELLLAMRGEIDEILAGISEDVEEKEVSYIPENFSGIPPSSETDGGEAVAAEPSGESGFRVNTKNTRKPPDEPEPDPEAVAIFDSVCSRLRAPMVQTTAMRVREPEPDPPEEAEVRERIAILVESGELDEEGARGFEELAHDPETRRAFARRYMTWAL
ncbi:MAG: hypothetical protein ACJ754_10935 [Pyrinomonadaceae bacterium]